MNTARSGSGPRPSTSSSTSKLAIWRPNAFRSAVASTRPRWPRSHTIMPAHVPRIGRPASAWALMAGSRPSRSIAFVIVVLSPPGMTRPSRSSSCWDVRTSIGSASSDRSISAWAAKSPWLASTPIRNRVAAPASGGTALAEANLVLLGPALLQQLALRGELCDVVAAHGLAELDRRRRHALRVAEVRRCLDDRAGATVGVLRLEDARAYEVPLGAKLHHQRRVGGRRDSARAEQGHGQPSRLGHLADDLHRSSKLLGLGSQLLAPQGPEPLDAADDSTEVTDGLDNVAGTRLALGADHRGSLADPAERLAEVGRATNEGHLEGMLVDVVGLVGRREDLGLVDVVDLERFENLGL